MARQDGETGWREVIERSEQQRNQGEEIKGVVSIEEGTAREARGKHCVLK
jgi:hypothetical protein